MISFYRSILIFCAALACFCGASGAKAAQIRIWTFADDSAQTDHYVGTGLASAFNTFESRTASASVDPFAGKLKAYATCDQDWHVAGAGTSVEDQVTYHGPDALLEFHLTVDGSYFIGDRFSKSYYGASIGYGIDGSGSKSVFIQEIDGGVSGSDHFTLIGYRWTTDGTTFPLNYSLEVNVKDQAYANFGSTATLSFVLPETGYVVSETGYDSRNAPEPASLSMLAVGALFLLRRNRSQIASGTAQ